MRIVRYIEESGGPARVYAEALRDATSLVIDAVPRSRNAPRGPNVSVRFKLDVHRKPGGDTLQVGPSPSFRDLLDLAISVYVADEYSLRASQPDRWRRDLDFVFSTPDPAEWARASGSLTDALTFLSGDRYSFTWEPSRVLRPYGVGGTSLPRHFDVVCLFSGGIDSLIGAYRLLEQGRRVLLTGYQTDNISAHAQRILAGELHDLFGDQFSFVQCDIRPFQGRTPPEYPLPAISNLENTHRTRSFLFLSLAVAMAEISGARSIVVPENGLIALSVPLQTSRIGTLSTRTAHPLFLSRMLRFLRERGLFDGELRNPLLYDSKSDLIAGLAPRIRELLTSTVSCAHPGRVRKPGSRHCGHCVPCLYRRSGMLRAGLEELYEDDVYRNLPCLSETRRTDFRALTAFANKVLRARKAELQMMVLSHGHFPPDIGGTIGPWPATDYSPWCEMLTRWAGEFLQQARQLCSGETRNILRL
jgi:7-cyano-7-deazaguanine synthase in queuosine biosynthesis